MQFGKHVRFIDWPPKSRRVSGSFTVMPITSVQYLLSSQSSLVQASEDRSVDFSEAMLLDRYLEGGDKNKREREFKFQCITIL